MMVIFVSKSEKKAIKSTQRVLDAFANRIGDNTWQTAITNEGLEKVLHLLRKSATKSTSVSCHWIRSRHISELLWIVGNKNKFDENGNVPVNTTYAQILKHYRESGWPFMPLVQALTAVAALLHDLGKASEYFQNKLKKKSHKSDPFRHELTSALIICGMYRCYSEQNRDIWTVLASGELPDISDFSKYCRDENEEKPQYKPFKKESSVVLCCIVWLVLTHHRLPWPLNEQGDKATYSTFSDGAKSIQDLFTYITAGFTYRRFTEKNGPQEDELFRKDLESCFKFSFSFSSFSQKWRNELKKWCGRLIEVVPEIEKFSKEGTLRLILKFARISLMLGDHFFSSLDADQEWKSECALYANTNCESGSLRQKLDEHLCGVKNIALKVAHFLPSLENELPYTGVIRSLKRKSVEKYRWQDLAVSEIKKFKDLNPDVKGAFILNMASTGCGKTTANAKIASVFGKKESGTMRFTFALGLRTITLQTGDEYRNRLHLTDEELAVVIGSPEVQYLHEIDQKNARKPEADNYGGSESIEDLFDSDCEVVYEGVLPYEGFGTIFNKSSSAKMLYAPVLCCTIDQMMHATECCRGGRYMLPFLRLMSSDLVIDEVDDYSGNDLKAVGRIIYLCGTLGRRVVLSSATIPPELAASFFLAYKKGFELYCTAENKNHDIMLAWINENQTKLEKINNSEDKKFGNMHKIFIDDQIVQLNKIKPSRIGYIQECSFVDDNCCSKGNSRNIYFNYVLQAALNLHENNHIYDHLSKKEVSFGVVRFSNIDPCVMFAKYLCNCSLPEHTDIKIMVYHSRQTLLLRHEQERYLDCVLKRHEENALNPRILCESRIRHILDQNCAKKILFIVVCTPIEEVGRDHDYDWAVIEPSSWRSIVQMSGRVNRHRMLDIKNPNVAIMQFNYRCFIEKDKHNDDGSIRPYFIHPGYETKKDNPLPSHNLSELLLNWDGTINAIDRLAKVDYQSCEGNRLSRYEHIVINRLLLNEKYADSLLNYPCNSWDLSAVAQNLSRFRCIKNSVNLTLRESEQDENEYHFYENINGKWLKIDELYNVENISNSDLESCKKRLWLIRDFISSVENFAALNELDVKNVMDRFGKIELPMENSSWNYSDQFGMYRITEEE